MKPFGHFYWKSNGDGTESPDFCEGDVPSYVNVVRGLTPLYAHAADAPEASEPGALNYERKLFKLAEEAYFKAGNSSDPQDWLQAGLLAQQHRNALVRIHPASPSTASSDDPYHDAAMQALEGSPLQRLADATPPAAAPDQGVREAHPSLDGYLRNLPTEWVQIGGDPTPIVKPNYLLAADRDAILAALSRPAPDAAGSEWKDIETRPPDTRGNYPIQVSGGELTGTTVAFCRDDDTATHASHWAPMTQPLPRLDREGQNNG